MPITRRSLFRWFGAGAALAVLPLNAIALVEPEVVFTQVPIIAGEDIALALRMLNRTAVVEQFSRMAEFSRIIHDGVVKLWKDDMAFMQGDKWDVDDRNGLNPGSDNRMGLSNDRVQGGDGGGSAGCEQAGPGGTLAEDGRAGISIPIEPPAQGIAESKIHGD